MTGWAAMRSRSRRRTPKRWPSGADARRRVAQTHSGASGRGGPHERGSGGGHELELDCAPSGVAAGRRAELRQHGGDVVLGGSRRDDEPVGDLRVREARRRAATSTSSWRAVRPAGLARVASRGPAGTRIPSVAHAAGDAPRQRLGAESAGDLDRLRRAPPRRRAARASARGRTSSPTSPKASAAAAPVAPEHRRVRARRGRARCRASMPATAAHAADAHRRASRAAANASRATSRANRSAGIGAPARQRPFGRELERRARSAAARRCARPARRDRPAARQRPDRRGAPRARRARVLASSCDDAAPALELAPRDPLGLVPVAGAQPQPGDGRGDVRRERVHLVLLRAYASACSA